MSNGLDQSVTDPAVEQSAPTFRTRKSKDARSAEEIQEIVQEMTGVAAMPDWADGFDNEDYPDIIIVGEGEYLFFQVLESNIIPLMDKRTNTLVETEVVQVQIMEGTDVRDKEFDDQGRMTPLDTFVEVGSTRSLWINSYLLKKIWQEWDVANGDIGALTYKGHVKNKSGDEYQKWMGKFKKEKPIRKSATR